MLVHRPPHNEAANGSVGQLQLVRSYAVMWIIVAILELKMLQILLLSTYCKTLIFSEPFNLAKLAIEIKTLKIKAAKIKP